MQECPICHAEVRENPRYPRYLCWTCRKRVTAADGRLIEFFDVPDGLKARYADTGEAYHKDMVFVDGIECRAREAHFGGVVIQAV